MEQLQLREKEIFETLKKLKKFSFVIIGGYAANCYALPRFSVDCDIVIKNNKEAAKICKELEKLSYNKEKSGKTDAPHHGGFIRYEKEIGSNFKVGMDILIEYVLDRQTNATFSADWVFENSDLRLLKGKTIIEQLKLRVINSDALFAMKFVTGRTSDIRDVFMLALKVENFEWAKEEISKRYDFRESFEKIKSKITSPKFKDNLQGVFGFIDEKLFERHKKALLGIKNSD